MKVKRKTTKKPAMLHTGARGKLKEIAKHALGLELRLDNMQTGINGRFDKIADAFASVLGQHRERIEKLEGAATTSVSDSDNDSLTDCTATEHQPYCRHAKPTQPEPVIPDRYERVGTKEEAMPMGNSNASICLWRQLGDKEWTRGCSYIGSTDATEVIWLRKVHPALPEALAAWQACDESEAWPMGQAGGGVAVFAASYPSVYSEVVTHGKPMPERWIPIKPKVKK